jgi:hypothetical protein
VPSSNWNLDLVLGYFLKVPGTFLTMKLDMLDFTSCIDITGSTSSERDLNTIGCFHVYLH